MTLEGQNIMRKLTISKVVVNMAVGTSGEKLAKAATVLEALTGQKPSIRKAKKTIKEFGIRKGENIACMVTLRGEPALAFLRRALEAVGNSIKEAAFDGNGNFSFGVKEHISIPGVKYDPTLGIFGFDVCIAVERPGYRVSRRRRKKSKIGKNHRVTKRESINFIQEVFGVKLV
ncbi:MAG: 50S ribosomal protein L5 [Candidatus Nezhaarchaeota archaeon]|nr:50S ribosomal protein L5 [Candidatus Nezhaarchaeota archaeon]